MTVVPCTRAAFSSLMSRRATLWCLPPPLCGPAGHHRSGEEHQRGEREQRPPEHHGATTDDRVRGSVRLSGAPHQYERVREERDRDEEVGHHELWLEVERHRELAQHGLCEHTTDQAP